MIPHPLRNKHLLIAATGLPQSGRSTAMAMLAEVLWAEGFRNLVPLDLNKNLLEQFQKLGSQFTITTATPKFNRPILLIDRLTYETDWNMIEDYTPKILIHLQRNPYREGAGHLRSITLESEYQSTPKWMFETGALPLRNDDNSFRLLKNHVLDLFYTNILTHKVWLDIYPEYKSTTKK